jgi:hypothetical protein
LGGRGRALQVPGKPGLTARLSMKKPKRTTDDQKGQKLSLLGSYRPNWGHFVQKKQVTIVMECNTLNKIQNHEFILIQVSAKKFTVMTNGIFTGSQSTSPQNT